MLHAKNDSYITAQLKTGSFHLSPTREPLVIGNDKRRFAFSNNQRRPRYSNRLVKKDLPYLQGTLRLLKNSQPPSNG